MDEKYLTLWVASPVIISMIGIGVVYIILSIKEWYQYKKNKK